MFKLLKLTIFAIALAQTASTAPTAAESSSIPHVDLDAGVDSSTITTLGPAPYEELKKIVAESGLDPGLSVEKRQACGEMGVYLCEHANFAGQCYWGAYPGCTRINPDPFWQSRITSVGPDPGVACYFWSFSGTVQSFRYPGGNCNSSLNDKVLYFHCNPDV